MSRRPPEPQPGGFLDPPRRNPPTAVGLATPPPPWRFSEPWRREPVWLRAARSAVYVSLLGAGYALGTFVPYFAIGVAAALAAFLLRFQIRRRRFAHVSLGLIRRSRAA